VVCGRHCIHTVCNSSRVVIHTCTLTMHMHRIMMCVCSLCGFPPFDETTGYNLDFPSPEWDNVSESAKDLIKKLLTVDPAKRLSANQALSHLWVSGASAGKQSIAGM
jgi:serine/threonine protein kinase